MQIFIGLFPQTIIIENNNGIAVTATTTAITSIGKCAIFYRPETSTTTTITRTNAFDGQEQSNFIQFLCMHVCVCEYVCM